MQKFSFKTLAGIDKKTSIERDEWRTYLDSLRGRGLTEGEAEYFLWEFCDKKKIKLPGKPVSKTNIIFCPNPKCYEPNDENAKSCKKCVFPLKVKCPGKDGTCGKECYTVDRACSHCGFELDNISRALEALKEANVALANSDVDGANKFMRRVNTFWEKCPGADEVRKNIAKVKKELKEAQEEIDALEKEIRAALGQRKLYEAQRLILKLRQIPQAKSYLVGEEQDVKKHLADIQAKLAKLPALSDIARKVDICEEIITVAADCQEAQDALAKYPPLPPSNLSVQVNAAGSVDLAWTSPASRKPPMFVVVRKAGAVPASPTDGQTLINDNLSNTTFTDSQCETGVYGYAVFTKRDKTIEQNGCRSNLVLKIEDVGNVSILPGNGSLTFSWKEQTGSRGMIVTRFTGDTPTGDGVRVPFHSKTGFVDSNLNNGTTYCYRFQTVFRGINGEDVRSPGKKVVLGIPQVPPKAIADLKASESNDGTTILQWSAPPQGEVFLFDVGTKPEIPVGTTEWTTLVELKNRFREPIPVLAKEQTSWKNTSTGVRYLLPITFKDGLAVFGKPATVIRIADISDLDLDYIGDRLRLTWAWPKGLQKVQISYRHDRYPDDPNDAQSAKITLSRQEYDMENSWFLTIGNSQEYYFCIYAFVEQNTQNAFSRGVQVQTVKTTIKYDLSIRRRFIYWGRIDAKLTLTIDSRHGKFPDLIVKRNFGKPPLKRDFGMPLMNIPAKSGRKLIVPLDAEQLEENTYMRIFVKNEDEEGRYFIDDPPSHEKLHLCFKKPPLMQLYQEIINRIFRRQT